MKIVQLKFISPAVIFETLEHPPELLCTVSKQAGIAIKTSKRLPVEPL
jgi:hypothetical protein